MPTAHLEPLVRRLRSGALDDGQLLERFAGARDEAAFATLVQRHGPMVLAVCRRLLRDWHAAQDAFQATFLVLARKANTLADPGLLPHWLHGVARRIAARARVDAARRRARERRAEPPQAVPPDEGPDWRDLRAVLDEEVARLPARQGAAVVLCYLEGRTNSEAGRRLGCSRGTVATLLARARARLRRRLTGRGVALPAGCVVAVLAEAARAAGVPASLTAGTVKSAIAFAVGTTGAAGLGSIRAAALAEGVARTMMLKKLKVLAAAFLVVALAGLGAGLGTYRAAGQVPNGADKGAAPQAAVGRGGAQPLPRAEPSLVTFVDAGTVEPRSGTATHRTTNFVVTAPTRKIAERVAHAAEGHRKAQAVHWLGRELAAWSSPCPIRIKLAAGEASGGATTFTFSPSARLPAMRMELHGTLAQILADTLPHEVTHTVLATWSGRPLPRWADEGAATLAESAVARKRHERILGKVLGDGRRIPLRKLLSLREYPRDVAAMYAQSVSLTTFLVNSGGPANFLAFLGAGERDSWAQAVRTYYDYRTVEELENAWLAAVKVRRGPDPLTQRPQQDRLTDDATDADLRPAPPPAKTEAKRQTPRLRLPAGPAPVQVLARLGADGRLSVWREQLARYVPQTFRNERGETVTIYSAVNTTVEHRYDLKAVRVQDTRGAPLPRDEIARRLKGETLVLASVDGRPVDPLHLRLIKEDTAILVLPRLLAAVPPPAPTVEMPGITAVPAVVVPAAPEVSPALVVPGEPPRPLPPPTRP